MDGIPTLQTIRLVLRPFRAGDADAVTELLDDPAVSATLETIPHPYRREYAEWWIVTHASVFELRRELHLAVVLRASDDLLGAASLLAPHEPGQPPQLGYWLGQRHWGHGYATEAVAAIVAHARRQLGVRRIGARCMVDNPASVKVLTKLGLRRVGRSPVPVVKGDRTRDVDEFLLDVGTETGVV